MTSVGGEAMHKTRSAGWLRAFMLLSGWLVLTAGGHAVAQPAVPPGPPAPAQPQAAGADDAKHANEEGQRRFDAGDYQGALEQFRHVESLFPDSASPKHKIALCLDKLGKTEDAIAAYERFVASAKGPKFAERVVQAKARITELQAMRPAVVTLAVTPSGLQNLAVTVDGAPHTGSELALTAGEHVIVISAEGHPAVTKRLTVQAGSSQTLAVTLAERQDAGPSGTPAKPEPSEEGGGASGQQIAAYSLLGVGCAGIVVGTVFGVRAIQAKNDFNAAPNQDDADKQKTSALVSDISLGVGIAAAGVGVVLLALSLTGDAEQEPTAPSAALAPYATPTGGGVAAVWTF
jgi:tetratricopeptide (TPR) repeat protein